MAASDDAKNDKGEVPVIISKMTRNGISLDAISGRTSPDRDFSYLADYLSHDTLIIDSDDVDNHHMDTNKLTSFLMETPYGDSYKEYLRQAFKEDPENSARSLLKNNQVRDIWLRDSGLEKQKIPDEKKLIAYGAKHFGDNPATFEIYTRRKIDEFFDVIKSDDPASFRAGNRDFILAPRNDTDLHQQAIGLSLLPDNTILELGETTSNDIVIYIMLHEAAHLRPERDKELKAGKYTNDVLAILSEEVQADKIAARNYFNLIAKGHKLSADAPQVFEDLRAISSLRNSSNFHSEWGSINHHATNAGYEPVAGESRQRPGNYETAAIALATLTVNSYAETLVGSIAEQDRILNGSSVSVDSSLRLLERYDLAHHKKEETKEIEALMDRGEKIAKDEPVRHYAAVKALYEKGFFNANSKEKEVAAEFVEAMERRVPAVKEPAVLEMLDTYRLALKDITPAASAAKAALDIQAKNPDRALHTLMDHPLPPAAP